MAVSLLGLALGKPIWTEGQASSTGKRKEGQKAGRTLTKEGGKIAERPVKGGGKKKVARALWPPERGLQNSEKVSRRGEKDRREKRA